MAPEAIQDIISGSECISLGQYTQTPRYISWEPWVNLFVAQAHWKPSLVVLPCLLPGKY